jgi:hypothetical protein
LMAHLRKGQDRVELCVGLGGDRIAHAGVRPGVREICLLIVWPEAELG